MRRFLFPLVVLSILLSSCAPVQDRRTLNAIEALMLDRPDSALVVLRGLQPRDMPGLHVRPLHALLLSEALDKNYIDLTDDSLALAANHFYGTHGSKIHRLKSWYYLGRVRFNSGNFAEAVICYNKALEYAEIITNYHYMGLINREIANAYDCVWDDFHTIEYIQKSIDSFQMGNEKRYSEFSQLALARMLRRQGRFSECKSLLNTMLTSVNDDYIRACIHELKGLVDITDRNSNIESTRSEFKEARIGEVLTEDSNRLSNLALFQQIAGFPDSSDYYINKAINSVQSKDDSMYVIYNKSCIAAERKNYEEAYALYRDFYSSQTPVLYQMLEQSISFYQGNYYQNESRINAMKARMRALSYGTVLLIMFMLAIYLFSRNRKQRTMIIEEMAKTSEIQQELLSMRNENQKIGRSIAMLFENRLNILQTLSNQYELIDDVHQRTKKVLHRDLSRDEIIDSFRDMMRSLRKDKDISISLEDALNAWKDGIMRLFRSVFCDNPNCRIKMTEEDLVLIPYFFSGMKQKTISYLTGSSEHALRERKRRIKHKIESLDDFFYKEKVLFLSNL